MKLGTTNLRTEYLVNVSAPRIFSPRKEEGIWIMEDTGKEIVEEPVGSVLTCRASVCVRGGEECAR